MSGSRGTLLNFLPLDPVTSSSYPKAQEAKPVIEGAEPEHRRRTSSLSSDGKGSTFRVLKVAPVHFGEHGGEHKEDWHEISAVASE